MALNKTLINLTTAIILIFFNLVLLLLDNSGGIQRYVSISIPLIMFVFIFIFKNNNIYIFYTITGILVTLFGSPDNFSGSIFFFMSGYDHKSKINLSINGISAIISICLKYYIVGFTPVNIIGMVVAFYFIIGHLYVRFWNIAEIKSKIGLNKGLTVEQLQTIEKLLEGKGHAQSAKELHIERPTFSARMGSIRRRYKVTNDLQLAISLIEDGVISINSFTNVKPDTSELNKGINT